MSLRGLVDPFKYRLFIVFANFPPQPLFAQLPSRLFCLKSPARCPPFKSCSSRQKCSAPLSPEPITRPLRFRFPRRLSLCQLLRLNDLRSLPPKLPAAVAAPPNGETPFSVPRNFSKPSPFSYPKAQHSHGLYGCPIILQVHPTDSSLVEFCPPSPSA